MRLIVPQIGRRLEALSGPWALMLIGLPGSGKTTFIERLNKYLDKKPIVLSTDNLIEARAKAEGKTYTEIFNQVSFKVFKTEMEWQAGNARAAGECVILDQTNMGSKSRRDKLMPFIKAEYTCISLGFDVPMSVLSERLKHRAETTGKVIPEHVIKQMLSGYSPPTTAEGFAHCWDYEGY